MGSLRNGGQITPGGAAAGRLTITGDYTQLQVVTFGSRSSTFATINGLDPGNGDVLTPTYSLTDLALSR